MRPNRLLLALSLAAAVAPAALAAHPSAPTHPSVPDTHPSPPAAHPSAPGTHGSDKAPVKQAKGPKGTNYLLHACVLTDATDTGVSLKVLGGNRHMRDALTLNTAPDFAATLDGNTFFRLVGKARPAGVRGKSAGIGTFDDVNHGDRVIVRFWATRGSDLAGVPAWRVIDRGQTDACAAAATPPTTDPSTDPSAPSPPTGSGPAL